MEVKDAERPWLAVDALLFKIDEELNSLKVLLIKKQGQPFEGLRVLPGGLIAKGESTFAAVNRTLSEKTGLKDIYLEQLYTYSNPERDPRMRVVSVAYMGIIPMGRNENISLQPDAEWFDVDISDERISLKGQTSNCEIVYRLKDKVFLSGQITYENAVAEAESTEKLGFDHELMIMDAVKRIRNKIEYTDLAFNFMGDAFTLPDLQRVYEIILGHSLYKKNFRDKILDKVERTDLEGKSIIGNRTSVLYNYKKKDF